jgi:cell wall-associated NlpC family hydrolase
MALEGLAAVQARIDQIHQVFANRAPSTATQSTAAQRVANADPQDFASLLASASQNGDPSTLSDLLGSGAPTTAGSSAKAQEFLTTALAEKGKPYVYGATALTSDPDPKAFDCSELTKWAAARVGVTLPDGATAQYLYTRDHGTTMSVDEALRTPGALLFHFGHEPKNLGDIPADGHVAISMGDGKHTIEARGRKYGTNVFEVTDSRKAFFNYAGIIPGM